MTSGLPVPEMREAAVYNLLGEIGITWSTIEHAPVFTVEESAGIYERLTGCHTKNLFLKDKKGGLWLAVVRSHLRVDLPALAKQLDAPRFSFGSAELLQATLGITPGSVTPFALMNDTAHRVTAVLDAAMLEETPLNFHPMRNDRTTSITPADLVRFVKATGHTPVIAQIPEKTG
ncbi:prolyl-tRNA synthetase associated domain-containing protein [Rhizomicrobium electricum]|uniref:Prolyl-tRNA synthetase associated domain-containing protein n=1 Tax=Rhizomicrobium electricum TaxID=480070 RepID=A0ABN1FAB1_9PROT|nr:prolyl-tRNA synthetase associated domain-containing protein [Rhizomicrobium electricum]NIJ50604.1 Ala-tRNA(Pro) deacylase [Rhizomicrobium electricum]